MSRRKHVSVLVATALAFAGVAVAEEKLETVEKRLTAQWAKQKSIYATISMKMEAQRGSESRSLNGLGTYEFMRKGEQKLFRQGMTVRMTYMREGQEATDVERVTV